MSKCIVSLVAAVLWSMVAFSSIHAQTSYTMVRFIAGAGGSSQGGGYTLAGAGGQPTTQISQGGGYVLATGFFFPAAGQIITPPVEGASIYLPYTIRH